MLRHRPVNRRPVNRHPARRRFAIGLAAAGLLLWAAAVLAPPALAHGFGERYDLPLPLRFFVIAGAAAVLLSFVVAAAFLRGGGASGPAHQSYPRYNLLRLAPVRWVAGRWGLGILRTLSVVLTVYVIVGALIGSERAALNPAPAAVYVAFWVGLSFFTALFGNLWALVNPWPAAWGALEKLGGRGLRRRRIRPYPARLGQWPAVAAFLGFAILETVAADAAGPRALGWILVGYTIYNFAGMYRYGRNAWLRNAEGFTLVYGLMARFAITEVRIAGTRGPAAACARCSTNGACRTAGDGDGDGNGDNDGSRSRNRPDAAADCVDCYECYARAAPAQRQFNLRPPCVGLNRIGTPTLASVGLVILLLATVSFDGLSATPEWLAFSTSLVLLAPDFGGYLANLLGVLGLPLAFGALFLITCAVMALLSGQTPPDAGGLPLKLAGRFAFSLLPIALAYHYAHFLGFLFVNGQRFIVLASDPFGWGWDLFGTADAITNIGILSPVFIWYFSITAIVVGHIAGVYLAHIQAVRICRTRRAALLSQLPMLALMVCYTCASLWIISRPIAE